MDIPDDAMLDEYLTFCERILLRPSGDNSVLEGLCLLFHM